MKLEIENAVFEYLKKTLNRDMPAMLVRGHSTSVRPVPYIVVDCSEPKPFGTLSAADGLFELVLEIRIADSAHDIDYRIQQKRVNAVLEALENSECSACVVRIRARFRREERQHRRRPEILRNRADLTNSRSIWQTGHTNSGGQNSPCRSESKNSTAI